MRRVCVIAARPKPPSGWRLRERERERITSELGALLPRQSEPHVTAALRTAAEEEAHGIVAQAAGRGRLASASVGENGSHRSSTRFSPASGGPGE